MKAVIIMYTIKNNIKNELIIKNSKFITLLIKINDIEEINKYLEKAKIDYPKATHYVYAYILGDIKKASDDKEPSNTAGAPILNVLEKENINKVLVIVIRYFGGIKLGAGGLLRAYTKSVTEPLNNVELIKLIPGKKIEIEIDYENEKHINYILRNSIIINQEFNEKIKYTVLIKDNELDNISKYSYKIISNELIEEKDTILK